MGASIAVWLDDRTAVLVPFTGAGMGEAEVIRRLASDLQTFFRAVLEALREAPSIFLFGPGGAKEEFKELLESEGLGRRLDAVETSGQLSVRQIRERADAHFRPVA
jgi:hypothetical protein